MIDSNNNEYASKLLVLCDGETDRQLFIKIKGCHSQLSKIPDENIRTYDQARNILSATKLQTTIQPLHEDDRPDFIFCLDERPILVTELTQHAYTGDNGLQRFARFAAAAENHVPFIYFGPLRRVRDDELDMGGTPSARSLTSDLFEGMEQLSKVHDVPQIVIEWKTNSAGMPATLPARFNNSDVREIYGELLDCIALFLFRPTPLQAYLALSATI